MQESALDQSAYERFGFSTPMSAAKETPSFSSGATEDGTFVVSDTLASECGLDVSKELTTEQLEACIKIFVKGMHDESQSEQAEWMEAYQTVTDDSVAAPLAEAIINKQQSATFSETTASDLEKKAEAVNTERGEIAYNGTVERVNQELFLKMMSMQASGLMLDSWKNLKLMDASYYDD
jgi:hypothetical protein